MFAMDGAPLAFKLPLGAAGVKRRRAWIGSARGGAHPRGDLAVEVRDDANLGSGLPVARVCQAGEVLRHHEAAAVGTHVEHPAPDEAILISAREEHLRRPDFGGLAGPEAGCQDTP